ncbi:MAG: nuclear transport factor 2 family protein [Streptosporangiaceae bacterium]|nr:nuclear transport factor 2 family protein [Streptosporangiaceae bacterium]
MSVTDTELVPSLGTTEDEIYLQIQRFYAAQSQLLDFGRFEEWAATFTEDCSFTANGFPQPVRTRTALLAGTLQNHKVDEPGLRIRHWFGMTTVEPRADGTVYALSYVLVIRNHRNEPPFIYRSTRCEDVLVRNGNSWLVRDRIIRRDELTDE